MNRAGRAVRALASPAFAAPASVVLLALLASATSLANGFVYDDRAIVEVNDRVHTLARWWEAFGQAYWPPDWGDTNYRPLTILSFAVQWALGDGDPVVFHAASVVLYVASCLGVLSLGRVVLPPAAAWVVAALFAVHPVHVEAVGNVVGQSEIVVAICATIAVATYIRLRAAGPAVRAPSFIAIVLLYTVACFSKETGFLLPGLLLAAEATVVATRLDPKRQTWGARVSELWMLYVACAVIGTGYLALRRSVLGGFGDDPNTVISLLSHEARLLTMLGVVPEWARLLLWPARLSADYSPPEIPVILGPAAELIPGALMLLGAILVSAASWQRRRTAAFALAWLAIAIFPVSNVVLRSGVILAERTLFLPSVGALLAVGTIVAWISARATTLGRRYTLAAAAPLVLVLFLGAARSAARQRVWRTSDGFREHIVEDAPLSYRAHHMHGMWLFEKGRRSEGERHLRLAIAMFPYDAKPHVDLADQYRRTGLCGPARHLYRRALELGTLPRRARVGLIACLLYDAEFAEASAEARRGSSAGGADAAQFQRLLALADSAAAASRAKGSVVAPHGLPAALQGNPRK
jgi:hypothetical protein